MKSIVYSEIFDQAWSDMKSNIPLVAGLTLVYMMGVAVVTLIPYVGAALGAGLTCGYVVCLLRIRDGNDIGFRDFFWAFTSLSRFIHQLIMSMIVFTGSFLGMFLLLIPGIWFIVASHLSTYIFVTQPESKSDGIAAIRRSIQLTKGRWWQFFGLLCLLAVLNFFGFLCLLFGMLVSIPLSVLVMVRAMNFFEQQYSEIENLDAAKAVTVVASSDNGGSFSS